MNVIEFLKDEIESHIDISKSMFDFISDIQKASIMLNNCLKGGGKILICGNGGSAGDSQHFAAELTGRFKRERKALAAIALTTDTSALTAIGNDYGFDFIFSRQVEALGNSGDILFGISTSGNSQNVINAIFSAKQIGMNVISLLGRDGGKIKNLNPDLNIIIPSNDTPRIQEMHIFCIHMLCDIVEQNNIKN